jgi:hypothetical protein
MILLLHHEAHEGLQSSCASWSLLKLGKAVEPRIKQPFYRGRGPLLRSYGVILINLTALLPLDDCKDAGGTTPRMGEVELRLEQQSRAMHGAIAERAFCRFINQALYTLSYVRLAVHLIGAAKNAFKPLFTRVNPRSSVAQLLFQVKFIVLKARTARPEKLWVHRLLVTKA